MDNQEVNEHSDGADEEGIGEGEGDILEDDIGIVPDSVENSDDSDNNNLIPNGFHNIEDASSDDETDEDIPLQPRILLAGLGAVLGHNQRIDDSSSEGDENESSHEDDVERERFDSELPSQHTYLGEGTEVGGRTILDDELVLSLPLLSQPGLALIPGQLLPLHLFHPSVINMMKKVIDSSKIFGVVNLKADTRSWKGVVGTTAEIFEYREAEDQDEREVGLKIKARGRQRFKLISTRRQVDGNLHGEVKMLVDNDLEEPLNLIKIKSYDRFLEVNDYSKEKESGGSDEESSKKSCFSFLPSLRPSSSTSHTRTVSLPPVTTKHKHTGKILSPLPPWVWDMYSPSLLVDKVRQELSKLSSLSMHLSSLPDSPTELSWWVAANLPLEDKLRAQLLSVNSPVQRLRMELSFLSQCRVLVCRRCSKQLGDQQNIFSMSKEGPQGAFVNPNGHVHETLTLYKAKNLRLVGQPSTEYSWFPGYAWTITECLGCSNHIGWKFTATNQKLRPEKFYGFSRRSIDAKLEVPDQPDLINGSTSQIIM